MTDRFSSLSSDRSPARPPAVGGPNAPGDTFDREAVQEILQIAIARRSEDDDTYSRSQLLDMARELGIPDADLAVAECVWLSQQGDRGEREAFRQAERQRLKQRFGKFAIVSGFLVAMDFVSSIQLNWSLLIALAWGLLLSLDYWKSSQPDSEDFEKRFQNWRLKQQTTDDWE